MERRTPKNPWAFTSGTIKKGIVDVSGEAYIDLETEAIVYTAADARRAQFDMSLAAGTNIAKALGIIAKSLTTADGVLSDPASEVLATRLDQDAMIVTARFWYSSKVKPDKVPASAAILAVRSALDDAGIELGGATTGIDIVNQPASSDDPSPT